MFYLNLFKTGKASFLEENSSSFVKVQGLTPSFFLINELKYPFSFLKTVFFSDI